MFVARLKKTQVMKKVNDLIFLNPPSASRASVSASSDVSLLRLRGRSDVHGSSRHHAGLSFLRLQQRCQFRGDSEWKVQCCSPSVYYRCTVISTFIDCHSYLFLYSRCSFVYGTPTMYIDLLSQDLQKYDLSSLEAGKKEGIICGVMLSANLCFTFAAVVSGLIGGSPCPQDIVRKLKTDMNMKDIMVRWSLFK